MLHLEQSGPRTPLFSMKADGKVVSDNRKPGTPTTCPMTRQSRCC